MENYVADALRYDGGMKYERCGHSGVLLPKVSLGFWHNFGGDDSYDRAKAIARYAFDHGVVHFDLANNYGPPFGEAERKKREKAGRIAWGIALVLLCLALLWFNFLDPAL